MLSGVICPSTAELKACENDTANVYTLIVCKTTRVNLTFFDPYIVMSITFMIHVRCIKIDTTKLYEICYLR